MDTATALDEFERDALLLVGRAAMQIRLLARNLPPPPRGTGYWS